MQYVASKAILSLIVLAALASGNVVAQTEVANDVTDVVTVQRYEGTRYVVGGVGDDQQQAVKALSSGYPLKITLASQQGSYLTGVDVHIKDSQGKTVLQLGSVGPLINVDLAPGKYSVELTPVEFAGDVQHHTIDVSSKSIMLNAVWPLPSI
jgi:hypothetical protein